MHRGQLVVLARAVLQYCDSLPPSPRAWRGMAAVPAAFLAHAVVLTVASVTLRLASTGTDVLKDLVDYPLYLVPTTLLHLLNVVFVVVVSANLFLAADIEETVAAWMEEASAASVPGCSACRSY